MLPIKKRKKIFEDELLRLPPEDKIVVGAVQKNDVYTELQKYLKDHDAKLYHLEHFEGEDPIGKRCDGSKEIYGLNGGTIGVITYKPMEEDPRIIVTVTGNNEIKEELKKLFEHI